jgi:hypothetical protein
MDLTANNTNEHEVKKENVKLLLCLSTTPQKYTGGIEVMPLAFQTLALNGSEMTSSYQLLAPIGCL